VQVGVVFPQYEIGTDPGVLREFAQTAEGLGYSHLLAYDHVLGAVPTGRDDPWPGPYTEAHEFHEPLTLFSYLAGVTTKIGFLTGVLVLPQRQTALVAKQATQLSLLSGGRLRLGVGVGWNAVEYEAMGADFNSRGRRLDDQLEILRRLWTEPIVDASSAYHRIDRAGIAPRPSQPVPLWVGGSSDVAYERAARRGDGFVFSRPGGRRGDGPTKPPCISINAAARLRSRLRELGRNPEAFGVEGRTNYADGPATWIDELERFAAVDFDFVAVNMLDSGLTSPAQHLDALGRYASEIGLGSMWT
jgi:probable F420-dependent oxidoreductase